MASRTLKLRRWSHWKVHVPGSLIVRTTAIPSNRYTSRTFANLNGEYLKPIAERGNLCALFFSRSKYDSTLETNVCITRLVKRFASNSKENKERSSAWDIMESNEQPQTQLTVGAKVAQAGRDVSYFGIILVGFAVTGALLWYVLSELFLAFSPSKIYSDALKKVLENREVVEELGEPIMGYGETTRRGRRRHVSYQEYVVDGEDYMRLKFYVSGSRRKGTVHVDVKKGPRGSVIYRYIFVELTDYPSQTIIIMDNR